MSKLRRVKKKKNKNIGKAFIYFVLLTMFLAVYCFLKTACDSLWQDLVNSLMMERNLSDENLALKTEISGITRERFLVLMASERLGLKRAKEEEVYVLK